MLILPIHATGNDPQRLRVQCPRSARRCPNMQGNGETSRGPLAWQQFVGLEAWDLTITLSKNHVLWPSQDYQSIVVAYVPGNKQVSKERTVSKGRQSSKQHFLKGYS